MRDESNPRYTVYLLNIYFNIILPSYKYRTSGLYSSIFPTKIYVNYFLNVCIHVLTT
jgi:hypothetical protein